MNNKPENEEGKSIVPVPKVDSDIQPSGSSSESGQKGKRDVVVYTSGKPRNVSNDAGNRRAGLREIANRRVKKQKTSAAPQASHPTEPAAATSPVVKDLAIVPNSQKTPSPEPTPDELHAINEAKKKLQELLAQKEFDSPKPLPLREEPVKTEPSVEPEHAQDTHLVEVVPELKKVESASTPDSEKPVINPEPDPLETGDVSLTKTPEKTQIVAPIASTTHEPESAPTTPVSPTMPEESDKPETPNEPVSLTALSALPPDKNLQSAAEASIATTIQNLLRTGARNHNKVPIPGKSFREILAEIREKLANIQENLRKALREKPDSKLSEVLQPPPVEPTPNDLQLELYRALAKQANQELRNQHNNIHIRMTPDTKPWDYRVNSNPTPPEEDEKKPERVRNFRILTADLPVPLIAHYLLRHDLHISHEQNQARLELVIQLLLQQLDKPRTLAQLLDSVKSITTIFGFNYPFTPTDEKDENTVSVDQESWDAIQALILQYPALADMHINDIVSLGNDEDTSKYDQYPGLPELLDFSQSLSDYFELITALVNFISDLAKSPEHDFSSVPYYLPDPEQPNVSPEAFLNALSFLYSHIGVTSVEGWEWENYLMEYNDAKKKGESRTKLLQKLLPETTLEQRYARTPQLLLPPLPTMLSASDRDSETDEYTYTSLIRRWIASALPKQLLQRIITVTTPTFRNFDREPVPMPIRTLDLSRLYLPKQAVKSCMQTAEQAAKLVKEFTAVHRSENLPPELLKPPSAESLMLKAAEEGTELLADMVGKLLPALVYMQAYHAVKYYRDRQDENESSLPLTAFLSWLQKSEIGLHLTPTLFNPTEAAEMYIHVLRDLQNIYLYQVKRMLNEEQNSVHIGLQDVLRIAQALDRDMYMLMIQGGNAEQSDDVPTKLQPFIDILALHAENWQSENPPTFQEILLNHLLNEGLISISTGKEGAEKIEWTPSAPQFVTLELIISWLAHDNPHAVHAAAGIWWKAQDMLIDKGTIPETTISYDQLKSYVQNEYRINALSITKALISMPVGFTPFRSYAFTLTASGEHHQLEVCHFPNRPNVFSYGGFGKLQQSILQMLQLHEEAHAVLSTWLPRVNELYGPVLAKTATEEKVEKQFGHLRPLIAAITLWVVSTPIDKDITDDCTSAELKRFGLFRRLNGDRKATLRSRAIVLLTRELSTFDSWIEEPQPLSKENFLDLLRRVTNIIETFETQLQAEIALNEDVELAEIPEDFTFDVEPIGKMDESGFDLINAEEVSVLLAKIQTATAEPSPDTLALPAITSAHESTYLNAGLLNLLHRFLRGERNKDDLYMLNKLLETDTDLQQQLENIGIRVPALLEQLKKPHPRLAAFSYRLRQWLKKLQMK